MPPADAGPGQLFATRASARGDGKGCVLNLENLKGIGLEPDGLIGLNVLKEFRVTLDFERSVVRLE